MKLLFTALIAGAIFASPAWAASGTMIKDDELRQGAMASAASNGQVKKGATVEVLARKGGWTQVVSGGVTGWVRILSVKTSASNAGGTALGLLQMGTARRDPSRVVAVAGVRGLNEEELRNTRYNATELTRMDQYISSRSDAEQFARSAGLRGIQVAYIDTAKQPKQEESSPAGAGATESSSVGGGFSF